MARIRKIENEEREALLEEEKRRTQDNMRKPKRGDRGQDSAGEDGS